MLLGSASQVLGTVFIAGEVKMQTLEKEQTYVYVELNHFAIHVKLTQHCKSPILQYKHLYSNIKYKLNL